MEFQDKIYMKGEIVMDFSTVIPLAADVLKAALPMGIVFVLTERLTQMFLNLAFPKSNK